MKTASNVRLPSWASKRSSRQKTWHQSLPRKGKKAGRNYYLDGVRNSLPFECLTKKRLLEEDTWRPTHLCFACSVRKQFLAKYAGKLIGGEVQLITDSCLPDFHLWRKDNVRKEQITQALWHPLILTNSKFYYWHLA